MANRLYGKGRLAVINEMIEYVEKARMEVEVKKETQTDTHKRATQAGVISGYTKILQKLTVKRNVALKKLMEAQSEWDEEEK